MRGEKVRTAGIVIVLVVFSLALPPTVSSFGNINANEILEVFGPRRTYVEASGTFEFFGSNRAKGAFSLAAVVERNESTFVGTFTANDITYTVVAIQTYNVKLNYSGCKLYIYGKWMIMGSTYPPYIKTGNGELKIYAHNTVLITITGVPTILGIATYYRVIRYPDPASLLGQPIIWVPQNYSTIQAAINAANAGDLIFVSIGTYHEHLVVNKSVTLVGEDRDYTIIDGGGSGIVVTIAADNVRIENFTIRNSGKLGRGISCTRREIDNVNITGNTLSGHGVGIIATNNTQGNFYILANNISDNLLAIHVTNNNNSPAIMGNVITQNFMGIQLENVKNIRIVDNVIFNNTDYGVKANATWASVLFGNNVTTSGVGLSLLSSVDSIIGCNLFGKGNDVMVEEIESSWLIGNTMTSNINNGLTIKKANNTVIVGNQIISNGKDGLLFHGREDEDYWGVVLAGNIISGNGKHGLVVNFGFKIEIEGVILSNVITNNSDFGLYLQNSTNVRLENNTLSGNGFSGVFLNHSTNITFAGNTITNNGYSADPTTLHSYKSGVYLNVSDNNTIVNNNISANKEHGIAIENSNGLTVSGNLISLNSLSGVKRMMPSPHSLPSSYVGNTITNNNIGIDFENVAKAIIAGNTIQNNNVGIRLSNSNDNTITHNNFINNEQQVEATPLTINIWDDGAEGNYWNSYIGVDIASGPNQDKPGADGICDTWHIINENNIDRYPLMGVYTRFSTPLGYIAVISNSTIQDLTYFESNNTIVMHVSNTTLDQTQGFCRLTIPHELIAPPYNITVNGNPIGYNTILENETMSIIYFTYEHSTLEIIIIPEIPSTAIILLLISIISTITIFLTKRKQT